MTERLARLGLRVPEVLLPRPGVDLRKWAVIACDQFTQDRGYWEAVEADVGDAPSCLRLIYPEAYLGEGPEARARRIGGIREAMRGYLAGGVFAPPRRACVYVERRVPGRPARRGLVIALDLERYDWAGGDALIRPSEETIPARVPLRVEIRRGAPLEAPHVIALFDDPADRALPGLGERVRDRPPLYDTELRDRAGSARGWAVDEAGDGAALDAFAAALETLERPHGMLFAVGDGNHSLAAARAVWEEYKAAHAGEAGLERNPARWALVELENLRDPALTFAPIHRVVYGAGLEEAARALSALPGFLARPLGRGEEAWRRLAGLVGEGGGRLGLAGEGLECALVETRAPGFMTAALDPLLDRIVRGRPGVSVDYIHGGKALRGVVLGGGAVGLLLPPPGVAGLFGTVARTGPLPLKSFSMGEALAKRFYMECRALDGTGPGA